MNTSNLLFQKKRKLDKLIHQQDVHYFYLILASCNCNSWFLFSFYFINARGVPVFTKCRKRSRRSFQYVMLFLRLLTVCQSLLFLIFHQTREQKYSQQGKKKNFLCRVLPDGSPADNFVFPLHNMAQLHVNRKALDCFRRSRIKLQRMTSSVIKS